MSVALEQRFVRTPDGRIWTNSPFTNDFWERYLSVFDAVRILARVAEVDSVADSMHSVGGDLVSFLSLPYYEGPSQYLLKMRQTRLILRRELGMSDAIILRLPGAIGSTVLSSAIREGRPWGAEIVGDPFDVFAPGAVVHPLRPLFRWQFTRSLKNQTRHATSVAYVSNESLQRRYPASPDAFSTSYSSVTLKQDAFVHSPRLGTSAPDPARIVLVGSLDQMYKGVDTLIDAMHSLRERGIEVHATVVGDGRFRVRLEDQARQLEMSRFIQFVGHIPSWEAVKGHLDDADIFVLPSRTEGLPRAMIEAMARGLPSIGTTVGGIPELLSPEDLVPPNDARALAEKLESVILNPNLMIAMSSRNLLRASMYREEALTLRRIEFYRSLRASTDQWMKLRDAQ